MGTLFSKGSKYFNLTKLFHSKNAVVPRQLNIVEEDDEQNEKEEEDGGENASKDKTRMFRTTIADGSKNLNVRKARHRVFVNRTIILDNIKYFGFDMDYTIAVYHSPEFESLCFSILIDKIVQIGYPNDLKKLEYDSKFPCRGLWFDTWFGSLLKVDLHGNILLGSHGFETIKKTDLEKLYPNMFVSSDDKRFVVMNTLFDLPEIYALAAIINHFLKNGFSVTADHKGMKNGNFYISYGCLFQDVHECTYWVHTQGPLKDETLNRITEFVIKDIRIPLFFDRLRLSGAKVFLLTNSGYKYTNKIMQYLFTPQTAEDAKNARHWTSYFDYVVVDANKPNFFDTGSVFREIDLATGAPNIGAHEGALLQGHVYSRGNCTQFLKEIGAKGPDVLYCGDHIFGDIVKSKKLRGLRTFLVVPDMGEEIHLWYKCIELYKELYEVEAKIRETFHHMDSTQTKKVSAEHFEKRISEIINDIDQHHGFHGSPFKSGPKQTYFSDQVLRFADLYAGNILNLLNYPFFYMFRAEYAHMPHERNLTLDMKNEQ